MTDDRGNRMPETLLPQDVEPPHDPPASIINALDMAGVGEINLAFERSISHPRPATFD